MEAFEIVEDTDITDPATFIQRCFFIFDDYGSDKEEGSEDVILFFWPPQVKQNIQLMLQGGCSGMINYHKFFSKKPNSCKILVLRRAKFAFKQVEGEYVFVLSAPITVGDNVLLEQLEMVYNAFRFNNGSFASVMELAGGAAAGRKAFIAEMARVGRDLLLYVTDYRVNFLGAFESLAYTELPPKGTRYFLQASQILDSLVDEPETDNLAGCLMYELSVLCSQVDNATTLNVLRRAEGFRSGVLSYGRGTATSAPPAASASASPSSSADDTRALYFYVFLTTEQLACLKRKPLPPGEAYVARGLPPHLPEFLSRPAHDGQWVGLYVLVMTNISLGVFMNLPALYTERHLNKIRLSVTSRLRTLDEALKRALLETPPSRRQIHDLSMRLDDQIDAIYQTFNYLVHDAEVSGTSKGCLQLPHDLFSSSFSPSVHVARDWLVPPSDVAVCAAAPATDVVLEDTHSVLYAHRRHGLERFYHCLTRSSGGTGASSANASPLGYIEKKANDTLRAKEGMYLYS